MSATLASGISPKGAKRSRRSDSRPSRHFQSTERFQNSEDREVSDGVWWRSSSGERVVGTDAEDLELLHELISLPLSVNQKHPLRFDSVG